MKNHWTRSVVLYLLLSGSSAMVFAQSSADDFVPGEPSIEASVETPADTSSQISQEQSTSQEQTTRTVYDIELKSDAKIADTRSAHLKGTATPYGDQYQVLGTQLLEPISVGLYTREPNQKIYLRVVKDDWSKPVQELSTNENGRIDLHFRTYDGFKLWVSADEPTDYQLVVMVGKEEQLEPAPAVVPASEYVAPDGSKGVSVSGGFPWLKIALGLFCLFGLVVIAGVVFFMRRKSAGGKS